MTGCSVAKRSSAYRELRDVVVDLAELLPTATWHKIVARLHCDHLL